MKRPLRIPGRGQRGATMAISALLLPVLILFVSFAVDLGRLSVARRQMQSGADVVALDMSRLANGRTENTILNDPETATTFARAIAANGLDGDTLTYEYGVWDRQTRTFVPTGPAEVPDAVQVVANRSISYAFSVGEGSTTRSAVSYQRDIAHLSLGTKFAQANPCVFGDADTPEPCIIGPSDNDDLNEALAALYGVDVSLGALTYEGLVSANVTAGELAAAGGFATVEEFADAELTAGDAARISALALSNRGDAARAAYYTELEQLAENRENEYIAPGIETGVPPNQYIGFDAAAPGANSAANVVINLFDFVTAAVEASNQANGLVTCTGTTSPAELETDTGGIVDPIDLGPAAIVGDELCTTVVSARKSAIGGVGDAATSPPEFRTAQLTIEHTSLLRFGQGDFGVPGLNLSTADPTGLLPNLPSIPLISSPLSGDLSIPIELSGAGAQARLTEIICDEETNTHTIDALIDLRALVLTLGNGQSTPIGTITAGTLTFRVYLDKVIEPSDENGAPINDLPATQTADGPSANPLLDLTVGPNDLRVEIDGLPIPTTLPPTTLLPTVSTIISAVPTTLVGPSFSRSRQIGPTTTLPGTTLPTTSSTSSSTTTSTTSTTLAPTTLPPTTTTAVPAPPSDLTEQALREYLSLVVNDIIQNRVVAEIEPILEFLGVTLTSSDLTNVGVGFPRYDASGNLAALDVQCASPTLVD